MAAESDVGRSQKNNDTAHSLIVAREADLSPRSLSSRIQSSGTWLEEQGSPPGSSGVARRVILRALEISSVLEFRKSAIYSQCDAIVNLILAQMQKPLNGGASTIHDGLGEYLPRLNLRWFDGATGGRTHDLAAQNGSHGAHGAEMRDIRHF